MTEDLGTLRQPTMRGTLISMTHRLREVYNTHERTLLGFAGVSIFLLLWEYVLLTTGLVNPLFLSAP